MGDLNAVEKIIRKKKIEAVQMFLIQLIETMYPEGWIRNQLITKVFMIDDPEELNKLLKSQQFSGRKRG